MSEYFSGDVTFPRALTQPDNEIPSFFFCEYLMFGELIPDFVWILFRQGSIVNTSGKYTV